MEVYLPPEVLSQIFARLPPKTLMQFRCVCRYWCSLIDEPDLISLHLDLYRNFDAKSQFLTVEAVRGSSSSSRRTFALRRSDTFAKIGNLFEYSDPFVYFVCPSIHGLLVCSNSDQLTLLNPSIRKTLTLPQCPLTIRNNPTYSCFLGYVQSNHDHKVVVFDCVGHTVFVLAIAVYSLRDGCWKERRIQVPYWCYITVGCGRVAFGSVYFQGAVYWRPIHWNGKCGETNLLSFRFDSEELCYMKLPAIEKEMSIFLFLFGGSLAVLGISRARTCIWVLETNGGNQRWWQYWNQDNGPDARKFFQYIVQTSPVEIWYIEETATFLILSAKKLVAYNILSNKTQGMSNDIPLRYMDKYSESMVLHRGCDGVVSISGA